MADRYCQVCGRFADFGTKNQCPYCESCYSQSGKPLDDGKVPIGRRHQKAEAEAFTGDYHPGHA